MKGARGAYFLAQIKRELQEAEQVITSTCHNIGRGIRKGDLIIVKGCKGGAISC